MEKLIIQSDRKHLIEVERFVSIVCDSFHIHNYAGSIAMSLLQAVENAIVHGNNNDSSKTVTIICDQCKGGVCFSVSDQGNGFDFSKFGSIPENSEQGTGIFIMKTFSDDLSFENGGRTVKMTFNVNGISASRALERIMIMRNHYSAHRVLA